MHPVLGSGLLCTLTLRLPEPASAAVIANDLNYLEVSGALPSACFGAWCVDLRDGQELIAHTGFIPNLLFRPMLVLDTLQNAVRRALWTAQVLLGESEGRLQRNAHEIVSERLTAGLN
jgi:hypothetical protein